MSAAALRHDDPEQGLLQDRQPGRTELHACAARLSAGSIRPSGAVDRGQSTSMCISPACRATTNTRFSAGRRRMSRCCRPVASTIATACAGANAGAGQYRRPRHHAHHALRTEYALLREAAIDLGISRTVAETWLERLRELGWISFCAIISRCSPGVRGVRIGSCKHKTPQNGHAGFSGLGAMLSAYG